MQRGITSFWVAATALLLPAPNAWAETFSKASVVIEVNATDGDAGLHIFADGEKWTRLELDDPKGQKVLDLRATGSVGLQGGTEFFIESAEPSFEVQPLKAFLARFPEGEYQFKGTTIGNGALRGKATLSHKIPAGPDIVFPAEDALLNARTPLKVQWKPVSNPFPGTQSTIKIAGYQVLVVRESPSARVFSVDLPPTATKVTISPEYLQPKTEYKIEVLAIEASGNKTLSERTATTR